MVDVTSWLSCTCAHAFQAVSRSLKQSQAVSNSLKQSQAVLPASKVACGVPKRVIEMDRVSLENRGTPLSRQKEEIYPEYPPFLLWTAAHLVWGWPRSPVLPSSPATSSESHHKPSQARQFRGFARYSFHCFHLCSWLVLRSSWQPWQPQPQQRSADVGASPSTCFSTEQESTRRRLAEPLACST